jgi:hypothetical protein
MKKWIVSLSVVLLGIGVLFGQAFPGAGNGDVYVLVSPQTLLLSSSQGGWITVHAAIPYGQVDTSSLELNGVSAGATKADARGELVAKFDEDAIKALVSPPSAVLALTGLTVDGDEIYGEDEVQVRE